MRIQEAERTLTALVGSSPALLRPGSADEFGYCLTATDAALAAAETAETGLLLSLRILDAIWTCLVAGRFGTPDEQKLFGRPLAETEYQSTLQSVTQTLTTRYRSVQSAIYGLTPGDIPPNAEADELGSGLLLFLRPLFVNHRYAVRNRFADGYRLSFRREPTFLTIEQALERVFAPPFTTGAVGGLHDSFGMPRIFAYSMAWQEIVGRLIEAVNLIVMIPSDSAGIRWELDHIKRGGSLGKTLLIMLPADHQDGPIPSYFNGDPKELPAEWANARVVSSALEVDLPEYDTAGAILLMTSTGRVDHRFPFDAVYDLGFRDDIIRRFATLKRASKSQGDGGDY